MQKTPMGMDEAEYEKRNVGVPYWKKFRSWREGYEAARNGEKKTDCPYKLTPDIIDLLRKRTRWILGWEQKTFTPKRKK